MRSGLKAMMYGNTKLFQTKSYSGIQVTQDWDRGQDKPLKILPDLHRGGSKPKT